MPDSDFDVLLAVALLAALFYFDGERHGPVWARPALFGCLVLWILSTGLHSAFLSLW